jgi:hypothetical protein
MFFLADHLGEHGGRPVKHGAAVFENKGIMAWRKKNLFLKTMR